MMYSIDYTFNTRTGYKVVREKHHAHRIYDFSFIFSLVENGDSMIHFIKPTTIFLVGLMANTLMKKIT